MSDDISKNVVANDTKSATTRQGQKESVSPVGSVGASESLRDPEVSTGDPRPSARGFGVAVGKPLRLKGFRLFQRLAGFPLVFLSAFDAFLMLLQIIHNSYILSIAKR